MSINHAQLVVKIDKLLLPKSFCENYSRLVLWVKIRHSKIIGLDFLTDKTAIDFDMLHALMKNGILGSAKSGMTITIQTHWWNPKHAQRHQDGF